MQNIIAQGPEFDVRDYDLAVTVAAARWKHYASTWLSYNSDQQMPIVSMTSTFFGNDGLACFEGLERDVVGSLALMQAGVMSEMFNASRIRLNTTCASFGYAVGGSELHSYKNMRQFFQNSSDITKQKRQEEVVILKFATRFNITFGQAYQMFSCTSQIGSELHSWVDGNCEWLDNITGSWVNMNLANSHQLVCHQGPFIRATYSLATLKATQQLYMHLTDGVAPVACPSQGFQFVLPVEDRCFPLMHMATRTKNLMTDPGAREFMQVESRVFSGSFFYLWARQNSLHAHAFDTAPGCHCLPGGTVFNKSVCFSRPWAMPVTREWWTGI